MFENNILTLNHLVEAGVKVLQKCDHTIKIMYSLKITVLKKIKYKI